MGKAAVDTNIMLYALDDFYTEKQAKAIDIIAERPDFCSQNLSEFANVCLRRWKFPKDKVAAIIKTYLQQCRYVPVSEQMILSATQLMTYHDFQFFDAIIVAAALDSGCTVLYSEDMSDGVGQRPKAADPRALCKHPYDCRARRPAINRAKSIHFECHPFLKQTSPTPALTVSPPIQARV